MIRYAFFNILAFGLCLASISSCTSPSNNNSAGIAFASSPLGPDTLDFLYQWSMSTDQPLWADSSSRRIVVGAYEKFTLELPTNMQYIIPNDLVADSSRVFIMDNTGKYLLCYNHAGSLEWCAGGKGEGPGEYMGFVKLALGENALLARDATLGRVDWYSFQGGLLSSSMIQYIQFALPYDLTNCLAFSCMFDDGVACLYNSQGEPLCEEWGDDSSQYAIPYFPYYRYGVLSSSGRFAAASYKHTYILFGSLDGEFHIDSRDLPYSVDSEISYASKNGQQGIQAIPLTGSMFIGPHGMVNIQMILPDYDGTNPVSISGSEREYSLVDRYSWSGEYLDSYIVPKGNIWSLCYANGYIYAVGHDESVYRFPVFSE